MRSLAKSKIISSRQCRERLWFKIHRPELRDVLIRNGRLYREVPRPNDTDVGYKVF